ncbi:MAG: membrane protein insertase YidC [Luteitalea sp.]|nr:membrane protein insertase YidC [Luteitalea sp.]
MEKRVLLAFLLSFVVLYAYQALLVPRRPTGRSSPSATAEGRAAPGGRVPAESRVEPDERAGAGPGSTEATTPPAASEPVSPTATSPPAQGIASRGERVVVETDAVRAEFNTRGAVLTRWQLKKYLDDHGQPVDLIPQDIAVDVLEPAFAITTPDEKALTATLTDALFQPSRRVAKVRPGEAARLVFDYQDGGLRAKKTFTIQKDRQPYLLGFEASVTNNGEPTALTVHSGLGIGDLTRGGGGGFLFVAYFQPPQGIFYKDEKVTRLPTGTLRTEAVHQGTFRYVGMDDHYFLGAVLPGKQPARVDYRVVPLPGPEEERELVSYALQLNGEPGPLDVFLGPKDFDLLAATDRELVRAINFGFSAFLAVPLLHALKWVHSFVGNYGWSIVILTVIINVVLFPLRHKSVTSMRKMQAIQPQVKAIQERYKKLKVTDPARQKMNTELMNLYREKGVNPASGCLPMVATFPVLFAFYSLLSQAIELRGAPFMLWIQDLSVHDPYYVTPLLMGASMILQQRMTPTVGMDPVQQKMMMMMPVMFTVFFLWVPSGLVVYWLLSNVWTIGQQLLTNKLIGPPQVQALRPAAERLVKPAVARKRDRPAQ